MEDSKASPEGEFRLIWKDLDFTADRPIIEKLISTLTCGICFSVNTTKPILSKNKGVIRQGQLAALLGPSGAGKSTLMKCLTQGRNYSGFSGQILVEGVPENEKIRGRIINQNEKEHLIPTLTAGESLLYASQLKNPKATKEEHETYVNRYLKFLKLTDIKNTRVEKCSGGQTKRLAVALELIAEKKPHFLFLDEPTSGLDSHVGESLIKCLRDTAREYQISIVTTIHQPNQTIFDCFSRAFIMSGDGSIVYNRSPRELPSFLASCGYKLPQVSVERSLEDSEEGNPPPPFIIAENPSDAAIRIASSIGRSVGPGDMHTDLGSSIRTPPQHQNDRDVCLKMIEKSTEEFTSSEDTTVIYKEIPDGLCSTVAHFSFHSLKVLLCRTALTTLARQMKFVVIRFALHLVVAGVLVALYKRDIGTDDACTLIRYIPFDPHNCTCKIPSADEEPLYSSNVKFQFFSLLFLMFAALMPTVLAFPAEIKLFMNEFRNGWYSTMTYYISKTLVEIPLQLIFPFFYCYFLFWYSKQPGMDKWYNGIVGFMSERYRLYFIATTLSCFIAQGFGFLIGIICVRSFNIAIISSSTVLLFLFLFSGFFVRTNQMGLAAFVITFFSYIRFGFEVVLISIFGFDRCTGKLPHSFVFNTFTLDDGDVPFNLIMLLNHLVLIRLIALFVLQYKASRTFFRFHNTRLSHKLDAVLVRLPCSSAAQSGGTYSSSKGGKRQFIKYLLWALLFIFLLQIIGGALAYLILAYVIK